jgi:voltage-gated potassium channel Kch
MSTPPELPRPIVRRFMGRPLTARRAGIAIAAMTLAVTVAGAVLVWLTDRKDFSSLGEAMWWALQTVTTVGYGDVVPTSTSGRTIASVVMLAGIGFLTVITASITAAFVEGARRRLGARSEEQVAAALAEISERLDKIERRLDER